MARATTQPARRPRGPFGTLSPLSDPDGNQSSISDPSSSATSKASETRPSESRRWRRRGDGRRVDTEVEAGTSQVESASHKAESADGASKTKRRRGSRGGRRHRRTADAGVTASGQTEVATDLTAPQP